MLPEEVSIITEEQRDWDDSYVIHNGRTYCFEYQVGSDQFFEIEIIHTRLEAQDLSLRCWFSETPNGPPEFQGSDAMDVFSVTRQLRTILVGGPETDSFFKVPAGKINYFMVQNLQNSDNFFKAAFNLKA